MYHLIVATPEKILMDDEVISITVPGAAGYFEVLTNHAPIISSLTKGIFTIKEKTQNKKMWNISGGIIKVLNNRAIVLIDPAAKL